MQTVIDSSTLQAAVTVLRNGGLVAFPTETVYGLGADAANEDAVRRIFAAKGRPRQHPLIVHVASAAALPALTREIPDVALRLAERFWPGPLTLIFKRGDSIPLLVTGGQETVAIRVPAHPVALELLKAFEGPVAAPSANRFGALSPTLAEHVRAELGPSVDLVLDGGPCQVGVESTILDLSGRSPRLLRPGGISLETLQAELGAPIATGAAGTVRAPGGLASHYAPRAKLVVLRAKEELDACLAGLVKQGARIGVLAPEAVPCSGHRVRLSFSDDPALAARSLYASLRELDASGVDVIAVLAPSEQGLGAAVMDRLQRAAAPRPEDADED